MAHHLHRFARLHPSMVINAGWYNNDLRVLGSALKAPCMKVRFCAIRGTGIVHMAVQLA